jgi:hypothetical protein
MILRLLMFTALSAVCLVAAVHTQVVKTGPKNTIWVSSTASADVIASRDSVVQFVEQAKSAGFDTVILYSKELNGHVVYPSKIAPRLAEHRGVKYDTVFDPLKAMIDECHKRGMRLHAAFDIFTEGNKQIPGVGIAFDKRKDWQSVAYDVDEADRKIKIAPIGEFKQGLPLWVNAGLPSVQKYEISIITEVVKNYDVDGVVMDRGRWNGLNADFSEHSRDLFRKYVGDKSLRYPQDVYELRLDQAGKKQIIEGKYYKQWHEWRASVIKDFFAKVRREVKKAKPSVSFESYVGSWYPIYGNDVGVNWASEKHKVTYPWASSDYGKTGYAELIDVLYVGLYYASNTEAEATAAGANAWRSVEGAARLANAVTKGATTVHGVINYGDDKLTSEQLAVGTRLIKRLTHGTSIFEASHVKRRNLWPMLTGTLDN